MVKIAIIAILTVSLSSRIWAGREGLQTEYQIPLEPQYLRQHSLDSFLTSIDAITPAPIKISRQALRYSSYDKIKFHLDNDGFDKHLTIRLRRFTGESAWQLTVKYNSPTLGEVEAWQIAPNPTSTSKIEQDIFRSYTKFSFSRNILLTKDPVLERLGQIQELLPELTFLKSAPATTLLKPRPQLVLRLSGLKAAQGPASLKLTLDLVLPDAKAVLERDLSQAISGELSFKVKKPDLLTHQLAQKLFASLSRYEGASQSGTIKNPGYYLP